ncbi:NlpC/P60 family protein [Flavobacterium sp. ASW18X]|nr:C40 family peptidase [Flavobacterium sp. ASW18X]TKD60970.1 NlpC/P60 family protein [Flavobacterium sp. ASW18X]
MFKKLSLLSLLFCLANCGVKKKTTYAKDQERSITVNADPIELEKEKPRRKPKRKEDVRVTKADAIVGVALGFAGTRYRYGGTTRKGMDCSGLVYVSLLENNISFPRVSYQMANEGERIKLNQVQKGDLLFFKTSKRSKRINHVGLVVEVDGKDIKFIHSTTSRGVIVSSIKEGYWNGAFVKATHIL